jgi:hypothetical protein
MVEICLTTFRRRLGSKFNTVYCGQGGNKVSFCDQQNAGKEDKRFVC